MRVSGIELLTTLVIIASNGCMKCGNRYSDWVPELGDIMPLGLYYFYSALINQMPSQVCHGCLLQFADDICLSCSGESPSAVTAGYVAR